MLENVKKYKCPFCDKKYVSKVGVHEHLEEEHKDQLQGLTPAHFYFDWINKINDHKRYCQMCHKPVQFNEKTCKYDRLCSNPKCKDKYVAMFRSRMLAKGKDPITQLQDPKRQKLMLENRKISGKYKWSDGKVFTYTGTYEKDLLEYLDNVMQYPSCEVFAPAPQVYNYQYDGKKHFYIPDIYLADIKLLLEVKGSQSGHGYRDRDKHLEILKEQAVSDDIKKNNVHYLKVMDKRYEELTETINDLRR